MKTPTDRAKTILDLCAYELKDLKIGALMNLEAAIKSEIELDRIAVMREINLGKIKDELDTSPFGSYQGDQEQIKLIRIRKREKK